MAPPDKVKPTPASVNPAADQATAETKKEVNTLVFNEQVFLLDYMNVIPSTFENPLGGISQVINLTSGKSSPVVNDFLTKTDTVFQFIQSITTEEYAQLTPKIELFLVRNDVQIPIPLSSATNLQKKGSDGYYSGNTVGLKSLSMSVDGATNPISGKIFNIEMTLLFDSVNTFFDLIPGTQVSYADVFRSYQGHNTSIKASIGYSSQNEEIKKKYSLDTLTFSAYLQFITSDIKIEENLKTVVKVKFQGYQEAIIADRDLFNFVEIDLAAQKKARDERVKDLEVAQNKSISSKKEEIERLNKLRTTAEGIGYTPNLTVTQQQNDAFNQALATKVVGDAAANEALASFGFKTAQSLDKLYVTSNIHGGEYKKKLYRASARARANEDGERYLVSSIDYKANFLKDLDDKARGVKESIETLEEQKRVLKKSLTADINSLRIGAINDILDKAIFSKPIFSEVKLNPKQLKDYIDGLSALKKQQDFFNQVGAPSVSKASDIATINNRQKENIATEAAKARNAADEAAKAREKAEKLANVNKLNANKLREEAASKTQEANKALAKTVKVDGIEELKKLIYEQKTIRYVLLGDLIAAVMDYLLKNKEGVENKKVLEKMRFFMTQINLINPFDGTSSRAMNMYNIPISSTMLQKFFSDTLYGSFNETMNLFELFRGLIDMIALTQKRRSRLSGASSAVNNNYSIQFVPYPVEEIRIDLLLDVIGTQEYIISTKASDSKDVLNGIIFFARESNIDLSKLGGSFDKNISGGVPHFFFGGNATGIVKSIAASEKDAKGFKKAIWEKNQTNNSSTDREDSSAIPAIFDVTIETLGMPYFQMGAYFYLDTPTINNYGGNWFLLSGYYQIVELTHEYSAGGLFTSTVKGILQISKTQPAPTAIDTLSAAAAQKLTALEDKRIEGGIYIRGKLNAFSDSLTQGLESLQQAADDAEEARQIEAFKKREEARAERRKAASTKEAELKRLKAQIESQVGKVGGGMGGEKGGTGATGKITGNYD